jgi:hypothetical protein
MRNGGRLRQGRNLLKAMVDAPPGQVAAIAQAILASMPAVHNVFIEHAELGSQAEIDTGGEFRWILGQGKSGTNSFFVPSEARMLLKTKETGNCDIRLGY